MDNLALIALQLHQKFETHQDAKMDGFFTEDEIGLVHKKNLNRLYQLFDKEVSVNLTNSEERVFLDEMRKTHEWIEPGYTFTSDQVKKYREIIQNKRDDIDLAIRNRSNREMLEQYKRKEVIEVMANVIKDHNTGIQHIIRESRTR